MERLPSVAISEIAQYLSTPEISACCATCKNWREIFNDDYIWKPRCDLSIAAYLKVTECVVNPRFVSPVPADTTLSAVSEWRLCYMREVHLWNNWREGRCAYEEITCPSENDDPWEQSFIHFLNNDQLILQLKEGKEIMLWDITATPIYLFNPVTLPHEGIITFCETIGDLILFMVSSVIVIYRIPSSPTEVWQLQGIYDNSKMTSAFLTANSLVMWNYCDIQLFDLKSCEVETVKRLQPLSGYRCSVKDVIQGKKNSKMFAVLFECFSPLPDAPLDKRYLLVVHVFNIEKHDFLKFQVTIICDNFNHYCVTLLYDRSFAIFHKDSLRIYNVLNSTLTVEVPCKLNIVGLLRFSEVDKETYLHLIINIIKRGSDCIYCFVNQCKGFNCCFKDYHRWHNTFGLFQNMRQHFFYYEGYKPLINRAYTRFVNKNGSYILNFW